MIEWRSYKGIVRVRVVDEKIFVKSEPAPRFLLPIT